MVLYQYLSFHRLHHTFSLCTIIPCDQASKLYSGRVSCYMLIKYEEELQFFLISRGVLECKYTKYYLIQHLYMLERTMYLAIMLLLVQYRFRNP